MEINDLLTTSDLETTPSGITRLENRIDRLRDDFIDEYLCENAAEGMWYLTNGWIKLHA